MTGNNRHQRRFKHPYRAIVMAVCAWLGVLMPLMLALGVHQAQAETSASPAFEQVYICTAHAQADGAPAPSAKSPHCPLCVLSATVAPALPSAAPSIVANVTDTPRQIWSPIRTDRSAEAANHPLPPLRGPPSAV